MKAQATHPKCRRHRTLRGALTLSAILLVTCDNPMGPPDETGAAPKTEISADVTGTAFVIVGAGDIASCSGNKGDEKTAVVVQRVISQSNATVFTAGDNAYENASASDYANCYDNSWGQFKSRTRPAIGNHEYNTGSAQPTFDYYGSAAFGDRVPQGYYSYDLGAWHIIVLNSNPSFVSTSATSTQVQWLKADLAATTKTCIMAMWHDPRFYSTVPPATTPPSPTSSVKPFWDALYAAGADLILNGHRHVYERFAPQDPSGSADPLKGIRQITIGTGGRGNGPTPTVLRPNSEAQFGGEGKFGVLKLTLGEGNYDWEFLGVEGVTYNDKGSATCHKMPSSTPNSPPTASFTSSCTGLSCTFNSSASSDPDGTITGRKWEFGDGSAPVTTPSESQTHTYAAGGSYSVKLTVTDDDNSTGEVTQSVTVTAGNNAPAATMIISCVDLKCSFNSRASTDVDGSIVSRFWTFGNGSTSTSDSTTRTYAAAGTYTVTLRVTDDDGASNTASRAVTVPPTANASPTAAFTSSCTNLSCTFNSSGSSDADGTIANRKWEFGDGTVVTNPSVTRTHTYAAGGTYNVKLTVTDEDGATGAVTHAVSVGVANALPTAEFTSSCSDLSCTFTDQSTDSDGTITSRSWNYGDGSPENGLGSHTYTAAGTYTVTLTVTDNGGATGTRQHAVTVPPNASPVAAFTHECADLACTFTDQSTDANGSIASWSWEFGDGGVSAEQSPSHSYTTAKSYTVKLTVTDNGGATSSVSNTFTVGTPPANSPPVAAFTPSCTNLSCTFSDQSTDPDGNATITTRSWNFGDGGTSTATNPSHAYSAAGTYSVELTVTDDGGLSNSVTHSVTVSAANASPTASFTSSCTNLNCTFNSSASNDSDGTITSRLWDFGDGTSSTADNPAKTYAAGGTYSVKLTVKDDDLAENSISKSVTVSPANVSPTASFTSSCSALACTFNSSASSDPDGTIASRSWDFGDGTTSTATSPSKTYASAGTYTVRLTVTDNRAGTGTTTKTITVSVSSTANSAPKAFFGSSCTGLTCKFTDRSTDADGNSTIVRWFWEFGNGKTFTTTNPASRHPSHTYAAAGTYKPKLTVTDNKGATGSIIHVISVTR